VRQTKSPDATSRAFPGGEDVCPTSDTAQSVCSWRGQIQVKESSKFCEGNNREEACRGPPAHKSFQGSFSSTGPPSFDRRRPTNHVRYVLRRLSLIPWIRSGCRRVACIGIMHVIIRGFMYRGRRLNFSTPNRLDFQPAFLVHITRGKGFLVGDFLFV
jgi:hypothetical protein